jgi:hypothetical protein
VCLYNTQLFLFVSRHQCVALRKSPCNARPNDVRSGFGCLAFFETLLAYSHVTSALHNFRVYGCLLSGAEASLKCTSGGRNDLHDDGVLPQSPSVSLVVLVNWVSLVEELVLGTGVQTHLPLLVSSL